MAEEQNESREHPHNWAPAVQPALLKQSSAKQPHRSRREREGDGQRAVATPADRRRHACEEHRYEGEGPLRLVPEQGTETQRAEDAWQQRADHAVRGAGAAGEHAKAVNGHRGA